MIRWRLRPRGGPLCDTIVCQARRSSFVDPSTNPAISQSGSARSGVRRCCFRPSFGPRPEDGSPAVLAVPRLRSNYRRGRQPPASVIPGRLTAGVMVPTWRAIACQMNRPALEEFVGSGRLGERQAIILTGVCCICSRCGWSAVRGALSCNLPRHWKPPRLGADPAFAEGGVPSGRLVKQPGLRGDPKGPLFRTIGRGSRRRSVLYCAPLTPRKL